MMPIRMLYQPTQNNIPVEVDVYSFHPIDDLSFIALMWNPNNCTWISASVSSLRPIETKEKRLLNE